MGIGAGSSTVQDYSRGFWSLKEVFRLRLRSLNWTKEGCIVPWISVTRWLLNCVRSISPRSVSLKPLSVLAASYLLRYMIHSPSHVQPIDRMNETPDRCKQTVIFTEGSARSAPFLFFQLD